MNDEYERLRRLARQLIEGNADGPGWAKMALADFDEKFPVQLAQDQFNAFVSILDSVRRAQKIKFIVMLRERAAASGSWRAKGAYLSLADELEQELNHGQDR